MEQRRSCPLQRQPAAAALLPGTPWDWFHVNAVHLDGNGNLLIDARNTWATYDVSRRTGAINWELGGKESSFTEQAAPGQTLDSANEIFAWQHDPEYIGHDEFTFFDNESSGTPLLPYSRAITVRLNPFTKVATLVKSDNQPEGLSAASQGNAQTTRNGDLFVGWGALPYFSEFSPSGQLLFDADSPAGVNTYRAYSFHGSRSAGTGGTADRRAITQGGAVTLHLPGWSPRFGAQGAPADSAGAPACAAPSSRPVARRSWPRDPETGLICGYGRPAANRNRRRRLHLLPSMMVSAVAARPLSWPVSVFSRAAGV